jgi:hypothetical protein
MFVPKAEWSRSKLGQLAKENGSNQAVKNFGDRMVRDHSKANDDLKNVASKKGVTLRDSMNASNKALYDRLSRLSGDAFDTAYMRAMNRRPCRRWRSTSGWRRIPVRSGGNDARKEDYRTSP